MQTNHCVNGRKDNAKTSMTCNESLEIFQMIWQQCGTISSRSQSNMSLVSRFCGANLLTLHNIEYNKNHLINDNFVTLCRTNNSKMCDSKPKTITAPH